MFEKILRLLLASCLFYISGCFSILTVVFLIMTCTSELWLLYGIISFGHMIFTNKAACLADEIMKGIYLW